MTNFKLWISSIGLAAAIVVTSPAVVSAGMIPVGGSQLFSYSGSSAGCSSCSATFLFQLLTGNTLKISFVNTSTNPQAGQNILTGLGFDTTATLGKVSVLSQALAGGRTWGLGNGIGAGNWNVGLKSNNGINGGLGNQNLLNTGWLILTWTSPVLSGLNINASVTKFQNAGPGGTGIQASPALSPTPEPGTLLLLSGGGALLYALRRRRESATPGSR